MGVNEGGCANSNREWNVISVVAMLARDRLVAPCC